MKLSNLKIFVLTLASAPLFAFAVPVQYPECAKHRRINDVPGASGAYFNEDCTTIYVLPPRKGTLTITGYIPSPNIGLQCERLKQIEQDSSTLQEVIAIYTSRIKRNAEEIKKIEEHLNDGLIPIDETEESLKAKAAALMEEIMEARLKIVDMQDQNDKMKLNFAKREGGRGGFIMESRFSELLQAYRAANPGLNVVAMPIAQAFLSVNDQKPGDLDETAMPAVLRLRAVGVDEMPLLLDPRLYINKSSAPPHKAPSGSVIFGGSLSGEVILSNIGACAVHETLGGARKFRISSLNKYRYITASAAYTYQVQVTRKHTIRYNFKELVRMIHEQVKRGGFFRTETLNSLIDERRTGAWLEFIVESTDGRFEYSDEYIRQVKKEFLDRALAQIVSVQTGSPTALLALIEPGKNGASEGADQLGKCVHLYCQMGSAGLRVLNSIFGSTSAVSKLLKSVSGEMVETVIEKKMIPVYDTYGFE